MKRILTLALAAMLLAATLLACTSGTAGVPSVNPGSGTSETPSPTPDPTPSPTPDPTPTAEPSEEPEWTYVPPTPATGEKADELKALVDKASSTLEYGFMNEESMLESENSPGYLGVSAEDYEALVKQGVISQSAIMSNPLLIVFLECNDAEAAALMAEKIAAGFDVSRWVCVFPDECFVAVNGDMVYFVAAPAESAAALKTAYQETYPEAGEIHVFMDGFGE